MPFDSHKNFSYSAVTVAPSPAISGLTLEVQDVSLFPATPNFQVTIWPAGQQPLASNAEIATVTGIAGSQFTITRAQEGSSARTILVGDQIALTITAKLLTDIEAAIPSTAGLLSNIRVSAGTLSQFRSDVTFDNSNGVSFGLNTNGVITGTVATNYQSQGAYLTTAMASNRGSDFVQATAVFAGTSASGTIASDGFSISIGPYLTTAALSNHSHGNPQLNLTNLSGTTASNSAGLTLSLSAAAPSGGIAASLSGNTAGALALVSTGTLILAGGNNITLSQNGQSITVSGANVGGAQTGISGIVVSDTTYTSGTVSFSNQNNITIGSSVNGGTQYIRLSVGNYLTTAMASNRGSDFVQATAVFNGTNATGTIASGAISVSVAAPIPIATTVNPVASANSTGTVTRYAPEDHKHAGIGGIGISTSGNTAGTTGSVVGTYWFEGGNSITVSQITSNNGSHTLRLSVGNYLTTAMASNRGSDFVQATAVFNGTNATGTIASGAISVSVAAPIPIGTAVKAVASVGSTGTITRYAPEDHQHAGVAAFAVTNTGNTLGNTRSQVGTLYLAASGAITASQSTAAAGNDTVWLSVAAQTNQSAIKAFGVSNTGQTAGNTGVSTGIDWVLAGSQSITLSQSTAGGGPNTVWFQHPAWLTTARASTDAIGLNTAKTNVTWTVNSSGLSLDAGGYAGTGTSATNASITLNSNGLAVSVAAPGAAAEANWIGLSGNTAGNTTASGSTIVWSGGNGVTLSGTNNSNVVISVNTYSTVGTATTVKAVAAANSVGTVTRWAAEDHAHAGVAAIGISNGNSSGTSGSVVGTYWLKGGNNITLSQITSNNGSHTVVISGPGSPLQFYDNGLLGQTVLSNPGQMTLYLFPFTPANEVFPGNMSVESLFLNVTQSVSTAATWTNQVSIAFYSSVNSTQLTRVRSGSTSWGTNAGNMNINDSFGGTRWLTIHSSNFDAQPVFSAGVRYWCAIWNRTSNNAGSMSLAMYGFNTLGTSGARSGVMGLGSVVNSTLGWHRFLGIYSVTFSSAMPDALAASDINKSVAQVLFLPQVILNNVGTNIV